MTTFFRAALGLLSPARVCRLRLSSLTRCASSIVRLSCAALYTGFGIWRLLMITFKPTSAVLNLRHHVPLHFINLCIHLPSIFESVTILDRGALPRGDDPEFLRSVRLPHAYVAIVRTGKDETRVGGEGGCEHTLHALRVVYLGLRSPTFLPYAYGTIPSAGVPVGDQSQEVTAETWALYIWLGVSRRRMSNV